MDSEAAIISEEEARSILERQLTSHQHIQRQAQSVIRIFIAAIPIIVTILITRDGNIIQIPSESAQQEAVSGYISKELIATSVVSSLSLSASLFVMAVFLALAGISSLTSLFRPKRLYPGLGSEDDQELIVEGRQNSGISMLKNKFQLLKFECKKDGKIANYNIWLKKNQSILRREYHQFSIGEKRIIWTVNCLFVSFTIYISTTMLNFIIPGIMAIVILLILLAEASLIVRRSGREQNKPDIKTQELRGQVSDQVPSGILQDPAIGPVVIIPYCMSFISSAFLIFSWAKAYYPVIMDIILYIL